MLFTLVGLTVNATTKIESEISVLEQKYDVYVTLPFDDSDTIIGFDLPEDIKSSGNEKEITSYIANEVLEYHGENK